MRLWPACGVGLPVRCTHLSATGRRRQAKKPEMRMYNMHTPLSELLAASPVVAPPVRGDGGAEGGASPPSGPLHSDTAPATHRLA